MFLRIVKGANDSIYQCDGVHIQRAEELLLIRLEHAGRSGIMIEVDTGTAMGDCGAWLMNDNGRTIDTLFRKNSTPPTGTMIDHPVQPDKRVVVGDEKERGRVIRIYTTGHADVALDSDRILKRIRVDQIALETD